MTPTARTLAALRGDGWMAEKVEQRVPIPGRFVTRDAFGFGDILAAHPQGGVLLVQATDRTNVNARLRKLTDETVETSDGPVTNEVRENVVTWLAAGGRLEIFGWDKGGARNETKRWRYRRVVFNYAHRVLSWREEEML